jgi:hypothetical protein
MREAILEDVKDWKKLQEEIQLYIFILNNWI